MRAVCLSSRSSVGLKEERARDVFRALYRKTSQGKAVQEVVSAALRANQDESLVLLDQQIASDGTRKLVCQAGGESHSRIETVKPLPRTRVELGAILGFSRCGRPRTHLPAARCERAGDNTRNEQDDNMRIFASRLRNGLHILPHWWGERIFLLCILENPELLCNILVAESTNSITVQVCACVLFYLLCSCFSCSPIRASPVFPPHWKLKTDAFKKRGCET